MILLAAANAFGQQGSAPRPLLLDGKPVRAPAVLERGVVLATRAEDGSWRDPEDNVIDRYALIADPKANALKLRKEWIHLAASSYRGKEGWGRLRWGMTKDEATRALGDVTFVALAPLMQLAFQTEDEGRPVTVQCTFASDRLATVGVHFEETTFEAASARYRGRYGIPFSERERKMLWLTPETDIVLNGESEAPSLTLLSKAFARIANDQMMNRGDRKH